MLSCCTRTPLASLKKDPCVVQDKDQGPTPRIAAS